MQINKLDHVNIKTNQLKNMIDWYSNILGMSNGDRPSFSSVGAWMYADNIPVIHLVEIHHDDAVGSDVELQLEHFAFSAQGLKQYEEKFRALEIPFRRSDKPDINLVQINVWDPDGNRIHLDFKLDE